VLVLATAAVAQVSVRSDSGFPCTSACERSNAEEAPFRVYGNTYYVAGAAISSVLIDGGNGLILIDGAYPASAPIIARHIGALGYRVEDIRLIVNSDTHWDHVGGIAAVFTPGHTPGGLEPDLALL
jgi:metallo-beta-lactamase class B